MKYLEALLAREAARAPSVEPMDQTCRPHADKIGRSPEAIEGTTYVSNVSYPQAHPPAKSVVARPDDRGADTDGIETFDPPSWGSEDFEERAAIMEYEGGLDRDEAERRTILDIADRTRTPKVID